MFFSAGLSAGCVSPGMSKGSLSLEGRIQDASGAALAGVEVEVLLPQAYGKRAKELKAGQAMDFGAPKRQLRLVTDDEGRFAGDLGMQAYAVDVWMFPPRGTVPAAPPPPAFLIRLPGISDENYYVCTERGLCVVMRSNGAKIPLRDSRIARFEADAASDAGLNTEARILLVLKDEEGLQVSMLAP